MTADLHVLLANRGVVSAGKVAALDLQQLKARIGAKWEKLAGPVHSLFEAAIKRSMKQGDTFFKVDDLSYVIVYRDLSVQEAQLQCAAVSREVCAHLFGDQRMEMAIRNVVGEIDHGMLRAYKTLESAINDTLERSGKETIISTADLRPKDPELSRPMEFGFTQQPRTLVKGSIEKLCYVYRPIWDCDLKVVLSYLCQPILEGAHNLAVPYTSGFCTVTSGDDSDHVLLDRAVLAHCVHHIEKLHRNGSRLLLTVPLHFATLARQRSWSQFNSQYRTIAQDVLRNIVFMVFGLRGVPNIRLVQEIPKLSGARYVFCAIEREDTITRFASTPVHSVGWEVPHSASADSEVIGNITSISREARQNGFESFALGIENTSRALAAMAAGVRYLEGPAIHPVIDDPRHAFMHWLEDLYSPPLAI